jgi:anaerobic ribonucleoside-triphosphate reductase activating protein
LQEGGNNSMKVRIAGLIHESVTDGPGIRSVLFFQGCPHRCLECHNPQTWSFDGGQEFDIQEVVQRFRITPLLSGVTFSGGEPFGQAAAAAEIAREIKTQQVNLWVYTGYTWEELLEKRKQPGFVDLINLADVIVDGPFIKALKTSCLPYRGSANQRIILVKESLSRNQVVLWEEVNTQRIVDYTYYGHKTSS